MVVRKILEQTLSAGSTSVSFTDTDIPNSLIRVFSSNSDLIPVSRILSGNTLTVTYEPQTSNLDVAVEIVKAGLDIVDNLTSSDADKALSAKQGNLLNIAIEDVASDLSDLAETVAGLDIPDNITDLDDVTVNNIQSGQVLAWNEDTNKFVNVNQSGDASEIYSTEEQMIGTYLGANLYRKVFLVTSTWELVANTWVQSNIPVGDIKAIITAKIQIGLSSPYSLHYMQIGIVGGYIAGNCFRNTSVPANGGYLILEYTK